jgi:hypothetical protein
VPFEADLASSKYRRGSLFITKVKDVTLFIIEIPKSLPNAGMLYEVTMERNDTFITSILTLRRNKQRH